MAASSHLDLLNILALHKIRAVKFEVIWVGEHMEFKGHEEVLDLVQVVVDEGLLEIFQEGGDDVVRWSWRF